MHEKRRANARSGGQGRPLGGPRCGLRAARGSVLGSVLGCVLGLLAACDRPPAEPEAPEGPHAVERADELRLALQEAQNAWSTGRRAEARARVQAAYREWFEPLEPLLRRQDALTTLELEFQFGALAQRMGRKGDPVALNDAVMDLVHGMDELVAVLPPPPVTEADPGPKATDALPVAVEVTAPKRTYTTYGDAEPAPTP